MNEHEVEEVLKSMESEAAARCSKLGVGRSCRAGSKDWVYCEVRRYRDGRRALRWQTEGRWLNRDGAKREIAAGFAKQPTNGR